MRNQLIHYFAVECIVLVLLLVHYNVFLHINKLSLILQCDAIKYALTFVKLINN